MESLHNVINMEVKTTSVSENWKNVIMISLYKGKGRKTGCKISREFIKYAYEGHWQNSGTDL